ncbi:MAG: XRE family transcriptional regulator [Rhodobacteraceae bacterium]|nr:XRE family transcriptional regulator [Paracoccaceae bacterium]
MTLDLFRERLACAIKQSGLSQRKISASIGKSSGYLTNVLNGNSTPSIEVISTLCHLLKVSPNYLCGYDHGLF